ncbi:hypothetical protein [Geofilum rubicundum]|uniref:hypothetical protein n=1 Tax=Geofilum rubicundum TaxID=472113 RepID=UPI0012F8B87E|nr:hypothetical protein [Geofilum rubicundum]
MYSEDCGVAGCDGLVVNGSKVLLPYRQFLKGGERQYGTRKVEIMTLCPVYEVGTAFVIFLPENNLLKFNLNLGGHSYDNCKKIQQPAA